jgi:hypothetical protein
VSWTANSAIFFSRSRGIVLIPALQQEVSAGSTSRSWMICFEGGGTSASMNWTPCKCTKFLPPWPSTLFLTSGKVLCTHMPLRILSACLWLCSDWPSTYTIVVKPSAAPAKGKLGWAVLVKTSRWVATSPSRTAFMNLVYQDTGEAAGNSLHHPAIRKGEWGKYFAACTLGYWT